MRANEIHKTWTSVVVPHHPEGQNFVRCLICGHVWQSEEDPVQCPDCGAKLDQPFLHIE